MSNTTLQEEMDRCQWKRGDECHTRIGGSVYVVTVKNVDIPTRRLGLIWPDGSENWVYMESCWKESV